MVRRSLLLRACTLALVVGSAPEARQSRSAGLSQPRKVPLVVLIVVDQLRGDLLDRYDAVFTGGFRRLRDYGFRFSNAVVDHAITVSHPGHATIATGMHPMHHGIVDGAWSELRDGHWTLVDPLEDSTTTVVGSPGTIGVSPRRFLTTALPDWFIAADTGTRTLSVGVGKYSSALHAGKARGDVFWYDPASARFVTSTYYRADYPEWLEAAQRRLVQAAMRDSVWTRIASSQARALALPDSQAYAGDHVHTFFPHRFVDETTPADRREPNALLWWQKGNTPFPDSMAIALTEAGIVARDLGRRGHTDYVSLVLSQADELGHYYGLLSQEQLDNLVRLDLELGEFFRFLDHAVGPSGYVVALTADHGVADRPEAPNPAGVPRRRLSWDTVEVLFDEISRVARPQTNRYDATVAGRVAAIVRQKSFVADVMTWDELRAGAARDSFVALQQHSYLRGRVAWLPLFSRTRKQLTLGVFGVQARLTEGTVLDLDAGVHMSPYMYDRSVPLIFMGPGIPNGASPDHARTVDVAPTLASIGHIPVPLGLDGSTLRLQPR